MKKSNRVFISGSAGTGKDLATYLMKLLTTDVEAIQLDEFNDDELREINYIKEFRNILMQKLV